jgi:hypothetical protein
MALATAIPHRAEFRSRSLIRDAPSSEKTRATAQLRFSSHHASGEMPMRERLKKVVLVIMIAASGIGCRAVRNREPARAAPVATRQPARTDVLPAPGATAGLEPRSAPPRRGQPTSPVTGHAPSETGDQPVPSAAPGHRPFPEHPPIPAPRRLAPNERVLAAMLSIHAHAFWPNRDFPGDYRPIPLADAVAVLQSDGFPLASLRKRRAVARLGAYGLHLPEFRRAISELGVNPVTLDQSLRLAGFDREPVGPTATSDATDVAERERRLFEATRAALPTRGCDASDFYRNPPDFVEVKGAGASAVLNIEITVPRPRDAVARAIDPQKWDVCSPLFAPPEHTYLVESDTNPSPTAIPAKPAGKPYPYTPMFEHFECTTQGCPPNAWFENLLSVTMEQEPATAERPPDCPHFVQGNERDTATYLLKTHLQGSASDLTVDDGFISAESITTDLTRVCMHKTLAFGIPADTGAIQGAWRVLQAEMGGLLAELACCPIEEEAPHFEGVAPPSCVTHH